MSLSVNLLGIFKQDASLSGVRMGDGVSQEEVAEMTKAIANGVIAAMVQFFNKHGLADGGIWYANDYRKYIKDEIDSEIDRSFFTGYAKAEFFEKTGAFAFRSKQGKRPSEALMSFLNGPTVIDCGNAITACYYKCILDIVGEDKFNQAFGLGLVIEQKTITGSGPMSFLAEFTDASKQGKAGVVGKRPLQIGDACYFKGVIWYGNKHPEGAAGGWNVIYIGDDADGNQLFTAHGFKRPLTEREINRRFVELYNLERTPQDDRTSAKNPKLYDKQTNSFLKRYYTILPEEAERNPEKFIGGFSVGSIKKLSAEKLIEIKKSLSVSLKTDRR
jgi:hypothetical protein